MPKGKVPYQYKINDTPISVANQYGITPGELLAANPGGTPFAEGQMINLPTGFQQALANRTPAYNLPQGQQYIPSTFQQALRQNYSNAYQYGSTLSYTNPTTFQQALRKSYPRLYPEPVAPTVAPTPLSPAQQLINQGVPPSVAAQMSALSTRPRGPQGRPTVSGVYDVIATLQQRPEEYDNLPPAYKDVIDRMLETAPQGGGAPFGYNAQGQRLDSSGNVWNPETATTDIYGGRFIQEGEIRWERNARGRRIRVQYGKGGKKRIISGGRGQHKRLLAAQQQGARVDPNERLAGFGLVTFNVGSG